jgi:uncharacterized protein YcsI (UPF0317 family)
MDAALDLRLAIRRGDHTGLTTGRAPGYVQANLVVLPEIHARDFLRFCELNAAACPVLGFSEPGSPNIPDLAEGMDVRSDLPGYLVHRAGQAGREVRDITSLWRDDLVAIAIGCWFSMEGALAGSGVRLRHAELGIQGPLFKTRLAARGVGIFGGPLVVSMRPFTRESVDAVRRITRRFSKVHGGPVHEGDPAPLGIADLEKPDFGEVLLPLAGEVPLYWACGLTAMVALQNAGLDFFITHAPGKMLVTDLLNSSLETPESAVFAGAERTLS